MWSPVGPHVQWDLSNVVTYGTCQIWSPVGPCVQWDLSTETTQGTENMCSLWTGGLHKQMHQCT